MHVCASSVQVQDASIAGSSDDEDILGVIRGPSTFANAFLYIGETFNTATEGDDDDVKVALIDLPLYLILPSTGLGTISLGSIIFFVGTGEKGFKTQELRMIGPTMAGELLLTCSKHNMKLKFNQNVSPNSNRICVLRD